MANSTTVPALKDEDAEHPVATAWRETIMDIVKALVAKDYRFRQCPSCVAPVKPAVAEQIKEYIADYGETIVEASEETWRTSAAQWMGDCWHVLVDLHTAESGRSDLAMSLRVFETGNKYRVEIGSVHVP